ncbi:peptidase MA family metallohydrolase [Methanooceanicella nereidis]|uniref:peptidase MA family metallohydrolase n=1 Tax=Methanooceanicella nereidis TaxID=2052831 RepID=UPI001E469DEA|nr:carboxypeptidase regulatory-like domain-containing protein [Methanocella sp. CWC-04]
MITIILLIILPALAGARNTPYLPECPDSFNTLRSSVFDVKYDPDKVDNIGYILDLAGLSYDQVACFFGGYPYRTTLEIASSHEEYEALLGIGNLSVSSMGSGWGDGDNGIIVIKSPDQVPDFLTVLTHELAHIALRSNTPDYKYAMPQWFEEGIAVYVSNDISEDKRRAFENICREGRYIHIGELENIHKGSYKPDSNLNDIGIAYTQSGMVIEYINDTYGRDSIYEIIYDLGYSRDVDLSFKKVIGRSAEEVNYDMWRSVKDEMDRQDGKLLEQKIYGYVIDHNGNTIPNQTVSFTSEREGSPVKGTVYTVMADGSGYYEVDVTYGPIKAFAEKQGYESANKEVMLDRGESLLFNITLDGSAAEARELARLRAEEEKRNIILVSAGALSLIVISSVLVVWKRSNK